MSVPVAVAPGGLAANAVMSAAASFSFNSNESAGAALSIDEVYQPELQPKTGDINIKVEWE